EFLTRASGQGDHNGAGETDQRLVESDKPEGGKPLLAGNDPRGGQRGGDPSAPEGQASAAQPSSRPTAGAGRELDSARAASGIGAEHDPNLSAQPSRLASPKRDVSIEGVDSGGPTRSEVIYGAAERGFATRNYRKVYTDYTQVVEEVMDREHIPPGMRFY